MTAVHDEPALRRWLELLVSLAFAAAFLWTCSGGGIDAMGRVGQVSVLATIEFRLMCFAIPLVVVLVLAARLREGRHFELASRLTCAAIAGLASATIAGGLLMTLHRTPYGLGGLIGDSSVLAQWARELQHDNPIPPLYPPLQIHMIAWIAGWLHIDVSYAIKQFQLLGVLLIGPAAYSSWRLLLRPIWALGIGVVAALPLIEAYRPYPFLSLIIFIPLALRFLQILRYAAGSTQVRLVQAGVTYGLGFGLLCLLYSGWLMWSAAGFFAAAAILFPWRQAPRKGVLLCAAASAAFIAIAGHYLAGVAGEPPIRDGYQYFDSRVEPGYIAMWRGDLPGVVERLALWPPPGELAGVGVFSLVLVVGFGAAIALGRRRTVVIGVVSIMIGTWLLRFWYASKMWRTGLVQLYPRTTAELLYCALILTGYVAWFVAGRLRREVDRDDRTNAPARIGAASAVLLLIGLAGSATLDRYMPREDMRDLGNMAWRALSTPKLNQYDAARAAVLVDVSSSLESGGWSKAHLTDNDIKTGYSSELSPVADREESIVVQLPHPVVVSRVVLEAAGPGFPVDFDIDVWDGERWLPRITRTGYTSIYGTELFVFPTDRTARVRLHVTKMSRVDSHGAMPEAYAVRLGELSFYE